MFDCRTTIISQIDDAQTRYRVEWPAPGDGGETLEVFAGNAPDTIDFDAPVCRDTTGNFEFDLAQATRHYFALRSKDRMATVTAARNVIVDEVPNFRDIGGYRVSDASGHARQVAWGRVYRSGQFSELTSEGQTRLGALGVACVIDFRAQREKEKRPNRWGGAANPVMLEVPIDPGNFTGFSQAFQDPNFSADSMVGLMQDLNRQIVTDGIDRYRRMFDCLLEPREGATVIQCASGKDRTGIAAALILIALGADRETVVHDYLLTRRYLNLDHIFRRALDDFASWGAEPMGEDVIRPMFDVKSEYIGAAFAEMDENFGGPEGYLRNELGMNDARIAALQDLLLD